MAEIPIISFQIEMAEFGGFLHWTTADGKSYKFNRLQPSVTAAISIILHGPNPHYDPDGDVFISFSDGATPLIGPLATIELSDTEIKNDEVIDVTEKFKHFTYQKPPDE